MLNRILSALLSLAMILSMAPTVSLIAYAEDSPVSESQVSGSPTSEDLLASEPDSSELHSEESFCFDEPDTTDPTTQDDLSSSPDNGERLPSSDTLSEPDSLSAPLDCDASSLSATVTWDTPHCGTPMTFTISATGGSGDYKYRFYSITDGDFMLTDVSLSSIEGIRAMTASNTLQFTFMTSGTYQVRFQIFDVTNRINLNTQTYTITISDPDYPSVSKIVSRVAKECTAACTTDYDRALWLHDWMLDHADYDYTYTYCAAEGILARGKGTCEAYQRAYAKLLDAVGISNARVVGNNHTWNAVYLDGGWYQIDPTWDDVGTSGRTWEYHLYFGLTDELMAAAHDDHTASSDYPCTSYTDNYFLRSGTIAAWIDPLKPQIQSFLDSGAADFTINLTYANAPSDYYISADRSNQIVYTLAAQSIREMTWETASGESAALSMSYESEKKLNFHAVYSTKCEHMIVDDPAVAPTCETSGLSAGSHCSLCKTVIAQQNVIPAVGHTGRHIAETAPDYETTGLKSHWVCRTCGRFFLDSACRQSVTETDLVISKRVLPIPTLISAAGSSKTISVSWMPVSDATHYRIYRKDSASSWKSLGTITDTEYTDTSVVPGIRYTYTVRAMHNSAFSKYDTQGVSGIVLEKPEISGISGTSAGITVTWSPVEGADKYPVYRSISGSTWTKVASTAECTYKDTSAEPGVEYIYKVRAVNGSSIGKCSPISDSAVRLTVPTLISAKNAFQCAYLSWSQTACAEKYYIYRKTDDSSWVRISTTTSTSYRDTTAVHNTTYAYSVRAVCTNSLSSYDRTGLSLHYIAAPTLKSAAAGTGYITVRWNSVPDCTGYSIYRKDSDHAWTKIGTSTSTSYKDRTVIAGKTYTYSVRALFGNESSGYNSKGIQATAK